jgi:hypothetical protein
MLTVGAGDEVMAGVWVTVRVTVGPAAGLPERLPHPARAKTVSVTAALTPMMGIFMICSLSPCQETAGRMREIGLKVGDLWDLGPHRMPSSTSTPAGRNVIGSPSSL